MSLIQPGWKRLSTRSLFRDRTASMAYFCTASTLETEAILLAGQRLAEKHQPGARAVAVADDLQLSPTCRKPNAH